MKKKRFTEEQIIWILREHEAGAKAAELARKYAVSEATLYNWKAKFGGMDVSEAKRLGVIVAAIHEADKGDTATLDETLDEAKANLSAVGLRPTPDDPCEVVADKGLSFARCFEGARRR